MSTKLLSTKTKRLSSADWRSVQHFVRTTGNESAFQIISEMLTTIKLSPKQNVDIKTSVFEQQMVAGCCSLLLEMTASSCLVVSISFQNVAHPIYEMIISNVSKRKRELARNCSLFYHVSERMTSSNYTNYCHVTVPEPWNLN